MSDNGVLEMNSESGLITAWVFDGKGGGRETDWQGVNSWQAGDGPLWVHLDRKDESTVDWLLNNSGLNVTTAEALLEEETRPRFFSDDDGLLVILRGVNQNPGSNPEDMVGLRIWIEENRVITVRMRKLMSIQDIRDQLSTGKGPKTPGGFLVSVADRLVSRMAPVIEELENQLDDLEAGLDETEHKVSRQIIRSLRIKAIVLRRYLAPQRDVLIYLSLESDEEDGADWLNARQRRRLHEVADRTTRLVEELDEVRERASILQDELITRLSESMGRITYVLTVVAAIMLPLSFITGLLGINVGGIPGTDNPWSFLIVCIGLVLLGGLTFWLFRQKKWL